LKNENNVLPLDKNKKVLVVGPTGNNMTDLNGGWSRTWQVTDPKWDTEGKLTIFDAIQTKVGKANAQYVKGAEFDKMENMPEAIAAAAQADVIVACLGEHPYTEKPGDIMSLDLPDAQIELVQKLAATGKPLVVVLVEGRPRIIRELEPEAGGIIMAYLPGEEGGRAVADVLFGDFNPSGKLPITYPRYANDLVTYDHKGTDLMDKNFGTNAVNPQYRFGHGLSYTSFEYSNLSVSGASWDGTAPLQVSVTVKNTGDRDGQEVVQAYVSDLVASVTPSMERLRAFEKISLKAGESKTVKFAIRPRDLAFVGQDYKWRIEPGEFMLRTGELKENFEYNGTLKSW